MAIPTHITDHITRALGRLPSVFDAATNLRAVVTAAAEEVQVAENAASEMLASRNVEVATGAALDQWGELVGEPRRGMGDTDYRRMIRSRVLQSTRSGEAGSLIRIVQLMTDSLDVHLVTDAAGVSLYYFVADPLSSDIRSWILDRTEHSVSAGVAYEVAEGIASLSLRLDSDHPEALDGGQLARLLV